MGNLNRRTVLGSAVADGFSADFEEWYALAKTQPEVLRIDEAWSELNAEADDAASPFSRHCEALFEIEARIFERVLDGPTDVLAVAEIGMIALFWSDKDERSTRVGRDYDPFELGCDPDTVPGAVASGDRAQFVLIQAAAKLYLGGLHG